jgi:hypothetical protein
MSRNPNICASCSSMADGMEDSTPAETSSPAPGQELTSASAVVLTRDRREKEAAEPAAHHVPIWP